MAIPEISMLGDFEAGMKCIQNPSAISKFFSLSGIHKLPEVYSFWKWGALILAVAATFSGIINRIKFLIIRVRTFRSLDSASTSPLLAIPDDDFDFSDDDTCSPASSEDEIYELSSPSEGGERETVDDDFRFAGSSIYREFQLGNGGFTLRRRRVGGYRCSWSDFAAGKNVVKLWDSFGFGLDFDEKPIDGYSQIPAVDNSSPPLILSAEVANNNGVSFRVFDKRVKGEIPAVHAEWKPPAEKAVGIDSGNVNKVYVMDDVTGGWTVGDLRNVKTALGTVKNGDGDTWWDADSVIVKDDGFFQHVSRL